MTVEKIIDFLCDELDGSDIPGSGVISMDTAIFVSPRPLKTETFSLQLWDIDTGRLYHTITDCTMRDTSKWLPGLKKYVL